MEAEVQRENSMTEDKNLHSDEFRASLTRLPQLADSVIRLNLDEELNQLHQAEAWNEAAGRSAKTLAKYADFRVVLISMKKGTRLNEHHADGRISIQCLRGRLGVQMPSKPQVDLMTGDILILDHGIRHDVDAIEESALLVTISWPGSHSQVSD
jgi:quercetin dioxygenase-like cupin family protein